jgi:hypothetical protein
VDLADVRDRRLGAQDRRQLLSQQEDPPVVRCRVAGVMPNRSRTYCRPNSTKNGTDGSGSTGPPQSSW